MNNKRIKILHTIRQGAFGGGETYLYNLAVRLNKELFEPVVLSFTEGAMVEKLKQEGIKTFVVPTLKPFNLFKYGQVSRLLKEEQIDIVHMHGTRAATNTLIPALLNKTKSIYTVHGWSFHAGNSLVMNKARILAEQFITAYTRQVICGSEADLLRGLEYCPEGKYSLIYNSIDTEKFNPAIPAKDIRSEFGFSGEDRIVAFIARLTYQKDPFTFIKSIPAISKQLPLAKFLMVGDGELKNDCIQLARTLNIEHILTFSPFRSDIKELLQLTDVLVLPSLWEVIPLGLLEAMAMEKGCIATHIPGTTEALINYENGLLINCQAHDQLAEKTIQLLSDEHLRRKLGRNARIKVINQFDMQTLITNNEALYIQLSSKEKRKFSHQMAESI